MTEVDKNRTKLIQRLGERYKELDCLYAITKMATIEDISLDEIVKKTAELIVPAWQYPEITCVRITLNDYDHRTKNFKETKWKQGSEIQVSGQKAGEVEVYYLEEKPEIDEGPFLKEERNLIEGISELLSNITERKKIESDVNNLAKFPSENPSPVMRIAGDGTILFANSPAKWLLEAGDVSQAPDFWKKLAAEVLKSGKVKRNVEIEHQDKVLSFTGVPVPERDYINIYGLDVTERKRAEKMALHIALHDPLTNLPNRRLFKDRLDQALAIAKRDHRMVAVLFIDLDQFKRINDVFGHEIGDKVLMAMAKRLKKCVRSVDTVSRFGGDEFTILAVGVDTMEAARLVAKKILAAVSKPLTVHDRNLFINATIGLSVYPKGGTNAKSLLRNADASLYRAKKHGKGIYEFFTPRIHEEEVERMALENDLRRAIDEEEIIVYYQPCVALKTQEIIAMEALARWRHPERGLLDPKDFISVAEETGSIVPLGEQVLRMACAQNKSWIKSGLGAGPVMVNVSGRQFHERDLAKNIDSILKETGLDPKDLNLEITENILIGKLERMSVPLYGLKEMGIEIIMDDFGIGYSSLGSLRLLPVNILKIDRSFISDMTLNKDDAAIVRAIMSMTRDLGKKVIAEGVETWEQVAFLRSLNCEAIQGYLFGRPVPAEEFTKLLRERPQLPEAA